jgi:hypothetical protein
VKTVARTCGIDFDNTLVTYDELLCSIARERGLLNCSPSEGKKNIRDRVRQLPNGEIEWQKCQALLYGSRIGEAKLIEGVQGFFELARRQGLQIYVISHKTEFSPYDPSGLNLRQAALDWMAANGFFGNNGLNLKYEDIFFADTRQQKLQYISRLQCTHFIDDLEETLLEDAFPSGTVRILYEPARRSAPPVGVELMKSWRDISHYFFGTN